MSSVDGCHTFGPGVFISGPMLDAARHAILVAQVARRRNGLPESAVFGELLTAITAAMSRSRRYDVAPEAILDAGHMQPTVPIPEAARRLGLSKRQTQRLAPKLGGRIIGGRWLLDAEAVAEHSKGQDRG